MGYSHDGRVKLRKGTGFLTKEQLLQMLVEIGDSEEGKHEQRLELAEPEAEPAEAVPRAKQGQRKRMRTAMLIHTQGLRQMRTTMLPRTEYRPCMRTAMLLAAESR